jgi:hypothetical protein
MTKGIQIGLLAVIAALLGFVAYNQFSGDEEGTTRAIADVNSNTTAQSNAGEFDNEIVPIKEYDKNKAPHSENQKQQKEAAQSSSENLPKTSMAFDDYEWDFGVMDEGDKKEHIFKFTNTGSNPLILETCKGSCGCTVPTCPKEPIPPGGVGEIKVAFNSKGKKNSQTKTVSITANTEPLQTKLTIKAQVTPTPTEE